MITKEEADKAYQQLILERQKNPPIKTKPGEVEVHHILPRSCGGLDNPKNKVALYAKEHFMAYVYLWIIHYNDEFHYQMLNALWMMCSCKSISNDRQWTEWIKDSKLYQHLREDIAKYNSVTIPNKISGEKNGMYGKCWIRNPQTKDFKIWIKTDPLPAGWEYGKYQTMTDKVIKQLKHFSQTNKGKKIIYNPITKKRRYINSNDPIPEGFILGNGKRTDEERKKISDTLKSQTTNNPEYVAKKIEFLRSRYQIYVDFGFEEMKKQFNYPYSFPNFSVACKKYLPEYTKHAREKGLKYKDLVSNLSTL